MAERPATAQAKADLADKLVALLFPAPVEQAGGWWLDGGVDELEGALIDIRRLWHDPDPVCLETLERVLAKLREARHLVEAAGGLVGLPFRV